jgi:hypothetical protein
LCSTCIKVSFSMRRHRFDDLTGKRFGRLVVVSIHSRGVQLRWNCICDCGEQRVVYASTLKTGQTRSCGCLSRETKQKSKTKHGLLYRDKHLYAVWVSMRQRCFNKNSFSYPRYGGRGIGICDEWDNYAVFYAWATKAGYRRGLTLDRFDNDGDYSPENCRWICHKLQNMNTSRNRYYTVEGVTLLLCDWSKIYNVKVNTIINRIHSGWPVEKAITERPNIRRKKRCYN